MHCTMYAMQCVLFIVCNLHWATGNGKFTMRNRQLAMGNAQWGMRIMPYTMCVICNVQFALNIVHFAFMQCAGAFYNVYMKVYGVILVWNILDIYQLLSFEFSHFCNPRKNIGMMMMIMKMMMIMAVLLLWGSICNHQVADHGKVAFHWLGKGLFQ